MIQKSLSASDQSMSVTMRIDGTVTTIGEANNRKMGNFCMSNFKLPLEAPQGDWSAKTAS